jgi:hypothetical protein
MENLFNIQQSYIGIVQQLIQSEGEISPELSEALEITQAKLQEKAVNYGFVVKSLDAEISIIDAEIKRLQEIKTQRSRN